MNKNTYRARFCTAFTLAEVLITLGIIGVVAAMTVPSLISNHNKSVVEARLSKAYNVFSNAIRLSEIDNGMMKDWPTGANLNMDQFWNIYMKPYFVGAKLCLDCLECGYPGNCKSYDFLSKWCGGNSAFTLSSEKSRILFQLNDGTIIFFPKNTIDKSGNPVYVSSVYIDINGPKKPNEAGRDVFYFVRNYKSGTISTFEGDCKKNTNACTHEIMSNGWKIPDDYPYRF